MSCSWKEELTSPEEVVADSYTDFRSGVEEKDKEGLKFSIHC